MPKFSQETDVHFRSLTGEGNFNWRMTYDFEYLKAEQKVVAFSKKNFFALESEKEKLDPILHVKVYDYDIFSSDDLLGFYNTATIHFIQKRRHHVIVLKLSQKSTICPVWKLDIFRLDRTEPGKFDAPN